MNQVQIREVLLVDDDEVSRELLMLFVAENGYKGVSAESGDEALALLAQTGDRPHAVLTDMQMAGTTGNALARELRKACGNSARLIAMSGSPATPEQTAGFDAFLLKPFTVEQLWSALEDETNRTEAGSGPWEGRGEALNEATYASLAHSMPLMQLMRLYTMCLDDAERRIGLMRQACIAADGEAYRSAAHAIKGGCGLVGALELAFLADTMEKNGPVSNMRGNPLEEFLLASARLRRILDARVV